MIRLRIGQRWKRERSAAPMDSIGLEVDGVDLLPGASEEPLEEAVPALVDAVHGLACRRLRLAQVSLPESHLEVLLARRGTEVELKVASLARPARLVRPPVRVELEALVEGVVRGARPHLEDLRARAPGTGDAPRARRLATQLAALGRLSHLPPTPTAPARFHDTLPAPGPLGFGAVLDDPDDLLRGLGRDGHAALTSLLVGGSVTLHAGPRTPWAARGPPLLLALELSRQGQDVLRALDAGEPGLSLRPAGVAPELALDLAGGRVRLGAEPLPGTPRELAAAMFELGLALAAHVSRRHPAQARNPYLVELTTRCTRGLAHLREESRPQEADRAPAPPRRRRPAAEARGLEGAGTLRRLRFARRWEQAEATTDPQARLLLAPGGPVVVGRDGVRSFSRDGALLGLRVGAHGAATAGDGRVVVGAGDRVLLFVGEEASARWFREDSDGLPLGPELLPAPDQLLVLSQGRTLLALSEATGRELWRVVPPRATRTYPAVLGERVLLATDAGVLLGLDREDGRLRFRVRGPLPFAGPTCPWRTRAVALLNAGGRTALWVGSAHTGDTEWVQQLTLAQPAGPLVRGSRLYVLGARGEEAVLVALDTAGRTRWERSLPLGAGPFALTSHGRALLATSADGTTVRVSADGKLEWRLGTAGEPLPAALAPVVRRGVAFVPGATVRAVDPHGGRVLAEVETRAPLRALAVDPRLTLYLLDEDGTLSAHRLVSHLGVVPSA